MRVPNGTLPEEEIREERKHVPSKA